MRNRWLVYIKQARSCAQLSESFRRECIGAIIRGDAFEAGTLARLSCRVRGTSATWAKNAKEVVRVEQTDHAEA